jgi:hypothetical protein
MIDTSRYQHSPSCRVQLNTDQIYPTQGVHTLNFDTVIWNENGCFDFTTQRWTAQKSGRIIVTVAGNFDLSSSTQPIGALHYDFTLFNSSGVSIGSLRFWQFNETIQSYYTTSGLGVMGVNVGDYGVFTFLSFHTNTRRPGLNPSGGSNNHASIFYLP